MTDKQLRARILEFAERCVISRNGIVKAYGIMPNSTVRGWYFVSTAADLKREYEHEAAAS